MGQAQALLLRREAENSECYHEARQGCWIQDTGSSTLESCIYEGELEDMTGRARFVHIPQKSAGSFRCQSKTVLKYWKGGLWDGLVSTPLLFQQEGIAGMDEGRTAENSADRCAGLLSLR